MTYMLLPIGISVGYDVRLGLSDGSDDVVTVVALEIVENHRDALLGRNDSKP